MMRTAAATMWTVLTGVLVLGCKGETKIQPDPNTERALKECRDQLDEKKNLADSLAKRVADLETTKGDNEIVVAIEGDILKVRPGKPGEPARPIDDKAASEASKQFIDLVAKSRGAIQKCYEQALKKDTALQARTVTLRVSASFGGDGAYKSSNFNVANGGSLGDAFDTCMKTIASKWALPANSPAMSFKAQVSLTPS